MSVSRLRFFFCVFLECARWEIPPRASKRKPSAQARAVQFQKARPGLWRFLHKKI